MPPPDGTPEEVGKWGKYVTLIRLAENGGQADGAECGIDNSSGDLIAFCDFGTTFGYRTT